LERITHTEKWQDVWFKNLSIEGKLLFCYLIDNCDKAGFYNLDSWNMKQRLGFPTQQSVVDAIIEIDKCYILCEPVKTDKGEKRNKLWLKNFLFHQKMLPLNKDDKDHQQIILLLERNLEEFANNKEMVNIIEQAEKGKAKKRRSKRFIKPTIEEWKVYSVEYAMKKSFQYDNEWTENLYDHYETRNWKPKGYTTQMTDWKAAMRTAYNRNYAKPKSGGKISKLKDANNKLGAIDYDKLGN